MSDLITRQKEVCSRFNAEYEPFDLSLMVGMSKNFLSGLLPLNGLRHPPEGDLCGWFLWAGEELSAEPEFFEVWHAQHLIERCPDVVSYLGLAPGWRFLLAGAYADVWFDSKLLEV